MKEIDQSVKEKKIHKKEREANKIWFSQIKQISKNEISKFFILFLF